MIAPPDAAGLVLDRFPAGARALRVSASGGAWDGAGVASRLDLGVAAVLLLPSDRDCRVDGLGATPGLAVASVAGGFAVLVGGTDADQQASRNVSFVIPGVGEPTPVQGGLTVRRHGPTATAIGDRVVVVGGGLSATGPAHDSFEVYDHATHSMQRSLAGVLASGRREHGATALPDGRVLVAGGVTETGGPALATAEVIDPARGTSTSVGELPYARRRPALVTLDDGTVLSIGGYGDGGSPYSTPGVFVFDLATSAFEAVDDPSVTAPPYPAFEAVPLVGGRVVVVGDSRPGLSSSVLRVFRHRVPDLGAATFERTDVDLRAVIPELVSVHGVGLPDGTLLLVGEDAAALPRAFVVDLGRGLVRAVPSNATASLVLGLDTGVVLELAPGAASMRRTRPITPWDNPPETLVADEVAFDAAGRWTLESDVTFEALAEGARFDLPSLAFRDFRVEGFRVETGTASLVLVGAHGGAVPIEVSADTVGIGLCETTRAAGADAVVERRGDRLVIGDGTAHRTCRVAGLAERVGVAVVASQGAVVRAPRVRRLP